MPHPVNAAYRVNVPCAACKEVIIAQAEQDLAEARAHLAKFRKHTDEGKLRDRAREFAAVLLEESIGADESALEGPTARVELVEGGTAAWVSCRVFVRL